MSLRCIWTGYRTEGGRLVDASRSDKERAVARMTVEEAARSLGIKEESVRKRVRRKKMRSEKDEDGRLYVYVDATKTIRGERGSLHAGRSADESRDFARELIESKDETIRILQVQLQEEREARRRADTSIAQLTRANAVLAQRVTELEATQGTVGGAAGVQQDGTGEPHGSARPRDTAEFPVRGSLIHPWWRRVFGG
jgi:excisionase family DNA binding protein